MKPWHNLLVGALCAVAWVEGCGGSQAPAPQRPFSERDASLFDRRVDYVEDPESAGSTWKDTWLEALDARCARADQVHRVRIRAVHTSVDLAGSTSLRLEAEVTARLAGPDDENLSLEVREGQAGFRTVAGAERRLLEGEFVAFLRREETDSKTLRHWYLLPASAWVKAHVRSQLSQRDDAHVARQRTIVVEH